MKETHNSSVMCKEINIEDIKRFCEILKKRFGKQ